MKPGHRRIPAEAALAISSCSLAKSAQILPKTENCERWMRLLRDSTIRARGHSNDTLESFDEGADAVVADVKACFRN